MYVFVSFRTSTSQQIILKRNGNIAKLPGNTHTRELFYISGVFFNTVTLRFSITNQKQTSP